ncbi:hypothetical protein ACFQX7_33340 [Luedemannella flava]
MFRPLTRTRRRVVMAGATAAAVIAAGVVVALASPASAVMATIYAAPNGTGTTCTSAEPCSLSAAQSAVRAINSNMSDDIVVQLADGVYRPSAPLRFTAADSGTNGRTVSWQAARRRGR